MYKKRGFTLVELLIVIAIIGILATIIIVSYSGLQAKSRDSKRKGDLQAIASGVNMFYADNKFYPDGKDSGVFSAPYEPTTSNYKIFAFSLNMIANSSVISCSNTKNTLGSPANSVVQAHIKCLTDVYIQSMPTDPKLDTSTWNYSYYFATPNSYRYPAISSWYKIMSESNASGTIDSYESGGADLATCVSDAKEFADTSGASVDACKRIQVPNNDTMKIIPVLSFIKS